MVSQPQMEKISADTTDIQLPDSQLPDFSKETTLVLQEAVFTQSVS